MTIAKKSLIGALVTSALAIFTTAIIISTVSYNTADEVIQQQSKERLISVREVLKDSLSGYLQQIKKQILTYSDSTTIRDSAAAFVSSFEQFEGGQDVTDSQRKQSLSGFYQSEFGRKYQQKNVNPAVSANDLLSGISEKAEIFQYHYITDNANPLGEKDSLTSLPFDSAYNEAHEKYHEEIRRFLQEFAYYDIFIIDAKTGHIVYSVFKELDYATSLLTGPYRNTGLADVYKEARLMRDKDGISFSAFKSYTPSYEDPAAFIASPIQNESGETIAVLAFQMPIDVINEMMTHQNKWKDRGLAESGETYLVGETYNAQSISRFLLEDPDGYFGALEDAGTDKSLLDTIKAKNTNIGFQEIRTIGVDAALAGETGYDIFPDYRNVPVLSAYTFIDFEGSRLALMAEIDEAEAFAFRSAMIGSSTLYSILVSLLVLSGVGFIVWRFTNDVSNKLNDAVGIAEAVAKGETADIQIDESQNDEVGSLMTALNRMQTELISDLKEREKEASSIKLALDVCATNVMMADNDFNIVYMNHAVDRMMHDAETDLQEVLPRFEADNVMGSNIDIFHQNPAHQRGMLDKLTDTYKTDIKVGRRTFGLIATPILGEDGLRLGTVVEWDDKTISLAEEEEKARIAAESLRIKQALDNVSANVMVADADRTIIYANEAVVNTLRNAQNDLRKELPNFDADTMMGQSIDQFHKNPAHQMNILDNLTDTIRTKILVGGRHMHLTVNPIVDDSGARLGTVVEWEDQTARVAIQEEMDKIITAANDGNLEERIDMEGKTDFFEIVGSGLNTLLDKVADFVGDVGGVFESMSEGDLTTTIDNEYRGEFETIKMNANNSVAKMSEVLLKIQHASGAVRSSASEVAQGSDDLSRRTESQASSLEETASSMEEITATVKQTSENATQANVLASEAKTKAQSGGAVVSNAVNAMSEILDSSNKINDIIGVIDEIAFQTNLLALNAAVEAARAGEQGRGFAVVAGEVRTLSQRSAAAAKEIKDLIRDSVNKVESGSKLVNQSGQTLAEIVAAVEKVASMIEDVNNATSEQNSGIGQINQAITQMDEMTQQNAALVEQTSAASRSMADEATSMNHTVSFFKLGNRTVPAAPVQSAPVLQAVPQAPSEPIVRYQPSEPAAPQNGAASFSNDDEWEDF